MGNGRSGFPTRELESSMTLVPIVDRELRVQARRPMTFWTRTAAATLALAVLVVLASEGTWQGGSGARAFGRLQHILWLTIWVVVPLITADCISRERREGTLGLLFLTPLRAAEIVVAKGLANALQALSVFLAAVPVLTVPLLFGGVSAEGAMISVAFDLSALVFGLAAGLGASALCIRWGRAVALAISLAVGAYLLLLPICTFLACVIGLPPGRPVSMPQSIIQVMYLATGEHEIWASYAAWATARLPTNFAFWYAGMPVLTALLTLFCVVLLVARRLKRHSREDAPSRLAVWCERIFCSPILWHAWLARQTRRSLERNPVGWLERRSWSGRLLTWGWMLIVTVVLAVMSGTPVFFRRSQSDDWMTALAGALAACIAFTAAGSFHRERETGVMELLLVSPLPERQIVLGRLFGIWGQFLPASALLVATWGAMRLGWDWDMTVYLLFSGATFLVLPVAGLYFSLRSRQVLSAWFRAVAATVVFPWATAFGLTLILVRSLDFPATSPGHVPPGLVCIALGLGLQGAVAIALARRLEKNLKHRQFVQRAA